MPSCESADALFDLVRKSRLIDEATLARHLETAPDDPEQALDSLVEAGLLTRFQAGLLRQGKHKGFHVGPYKVLRPLGKGGMGVVYLAEHTDLRRQVALKLVLSERVHEAGAVERFFREGRACAALNHPNIIRIHDFGQDGDTRYLVMEYVEGRNLEDIFKRRGRLPFGETADYGLQAALALQHAHERGLIHRDIKPANILLDRSGTVKVLDLGLARFVEDTKDNLTERLGGNAILGSPDYIAPEQAMNQADERSDVYALGATLYTLMSGQPLFPEPSIRQKLLAHQVRQPVLLHVREPSVPLELSQAIHRMLAKLPEKRFQTMAEVAEALRPWAGVAVPARAAVASPVANERPGPFAFLARLKAWLWRRRA